MDKAESDKYRGRVIAERYEIVTLLGSGGMGSVFLVKDRFLNGSLVAIKVLHKQLTANPEFVQRFLREVQAMRLVTHPNVVRTFDTGQHGGYYFYTMECLQGKTLAELINSHDPDDPLPWSKIERILKQICLGLRAIHNAQLVHRDLKPENLFLEEHDVIKITDFGIVRTSNSSLTQTDSILGTLHYLAPEMWNGDSPTQQTDLYALGVILYELLTGCLPFPAETPASLMKMHLTDTPEPPSSFRADLPFWADLLVQKLLAKELEDRPRSVEAVIQTLDSPPKNPVSRSRRPSNPPLDAPLLKRPPTDNGVDLSEELRRTLSDNNLESDPLSHRLSGPGSASRIESAAFTSANSLKAVDLKLENEKKVRSSSMKFIMRAFSGGSEADEAANNPYNVRGRSLRMMMKEGKPTLYPEDAAIQIAQPSDFAMAPGGSGTQRSFRSSQSESKAMTIALLVLCVLVFIGVLAFPHYSYLFRKQKQEPLALLLSSDSNGELNSVEHLVALYRKDFLRSDAFLFHYQAFQTEMKILYPKEELNFRRQETPEGASVLLLVAPPPGEH